MIEIAGGILLALAILAAGFMLVSLFIAGVVTEIAWALLKWAAKLALVLLTIALLASIGHLHGIWPDIAALTALGLIIYLDAQDA